MIKKIYYICLQRIYVFFANMINLVRNNNYDVKVLMFHRLSENFENDFYTINVNNFKNLIEYLDKEDLIKKIEVLNKKKKTILITFDDAYDSVYKYARDVLKKKNIPYYVFLCNELIDKDGYLSTDQIKEMISDGNCVIGSHLYNHIISRFTNDKKLEEMMINSKKELEEKFGINVNTFAFPYGSIYAVSKKNVELANKHFDYVFTTIPLNCKMSGKKTLNRFNMNDKEIKRIMKDV